MPTALPPTPPAIIQQVQLPVRQESTRAKLAKDLALCASLDKSGAEPILFDPEHARQRFFHREHCMDAIEQAVHDGSISDLPALMLALRGMPFTGTAGEDNVANIAESLSTTIQATAKATTALPYSTPDMQEKDLITKPFTLDEITSVTSNTVRPLPSLQQNRAIRISASAAYIISMADVVMRPEHYALAGKSLSETLAVERASKPADDDRLLAGGCLVNDKFAELGTCQKTAIRNALEMVVKGKAKPYDARLYRLAGNSVPTPKPASVRQVQLPITPRTERARIDSAQRLAICANLSTPHLARTGLVDEARKCLADVDQAVRHGTIADAPAITLALRNMPLSGANGEDNVARVADALMEAIATAPESATKLDYQSDRRAKHISATPFTPEEIAKASLAIPMPPIASLTPARIIPIDTSTAYIMGAADVTIEPLRYILPGKTLAETLAEARKKHTVAEDEKRAIACMLTDGSVTLQQCQSVAGRITIAMMLKGQAKSYDARLYNPARLAPTAQ